MGIHFREMRNKQGCRYLAVLFLTHNTRTGSVGPPHHYQRHPSTGGVGSSQNASFNRNTHCLPQLRRKSTGALRVSYFFPFTYYGSRFCAAVFGLILEGGRGSIYHALGFFDSLIFQFYSPPLPPEEKRLLLTMNLLFPAPRPSQ